MIFPTMLTAGLALAALVPAASAAGIKLDLELRGPRANATVTAQVSGSGPNDHQQLGRFIPNEKTFEIISRRAANDTTRGYRFLMSTNRWPATSIRFEYHTGNVNDDTDSNYEAIRISLLRIIELDSTNHPVGVPFLLTNGDLWAPPAGTLVTHSSGAKFIEIVSKFINGLVTVDLTARLSPVNLAADATLGADLTANRLYYGLKVSGYQQQVPGSRMAIVKGVFTSSNDMDVTRQDKGDVTYGRSRFAWSKNVTLTGNAATSSAVDVIDVASLAATVQSSNKTDIELQAHLLVFVIQRPLPFASVTWDPEVGSSSSAVVDDGFSPSSAGVRPAINAALSLAAVALVFHAL